MRLVLITENFPPLRTSGAVQLRDLSRELVRQGHSLSVLVPTPEQKKSWELERNADGVQILRLKAPKTKDVGYIRRTLAELVMPFSMLWHLRKSPLVNEKWDGIVWYSPSIFFGPLVNSLKRWSGCKSYLIVRDIFPQWAADMGLMKRGGLPYICFDAVARYQYSVADVIGVQTAGNLDYFKRWSTTPGSQLEVLQNWLGNPANRKCSIRVDQTKLARRKVFVYAGNMGVAQGMDILLALADKLRDRQDVGFLFVGRGIEVPRLIEKAEALQLRNTVFFDEIDPDEIPDLYAQCSVGIVALDPRHRSHNIPGKFLTYIQNGLPVLATVNPGNDLAVMVRDERVGQVCETNNIDELFQLAEQLLKQIDVDVELPIRCKQLFGQQFAVESISKQIVNALMRDPQSHGL